MCQGWGQVCTKDREWGDLSKREKGRAGVIDAEIGAQRGEGSSPGSHCVQGAEMGQALDLPAPFQDSPCWADSLIQGRLGIPPSVSFLHAAAFLGTGKLTLGGLPSTARGLCLTDARTRASRFAFSTFLNPRLQRFGCFFPGLPKTRRMCPWHGIFPCFPVSGMLGAQLWLC